MITFFLATEREDIMAKARKGSIDAIMYDCNSVNINHSQNINKHFKLIRLHMFIGGGNRNYSWTEVISHIKEQNPVDKVLQSPTKLQAAAKIIQHIAMLRADATLQQHNVFQGKYTPNLCEPRFVRISTYKLILMATFKDFSVFKSFSWLVKEVYKRFHKRHKEKLSSSWSPSDTNSIFILFKGPSRYFITDRGKTSYNQIDFKVGLYSFVCFGWRSPFYCFQWHNRNNNKTKLIFPNGLKTCGGF